MVSVLQVVVIVVLGSGTCIVGLELLCEILRELADYFNRVTIGSVFYTLVKGIHTVGFGEFVTLVVIMVVEGVRMVRCHSQENRVVPVSGPIVQASCG